jgi:hypothetical protein
MRNIQLSFSIACLCVLAACGTTASRDSTRTTHAVSYPIPFFASKEEAITSAEKSFAGGSFQELDVAGRKVLVLYHYASGAFSSDAAIYLKNNENWRLVSYYNSILNDSIEASAEDGVVVLRAHQTKQVLLTVSVTPNDRPNTALEPTPTAP